MNVYLLDTNVVSELRKGPRTHLAVQAWNGRVAGDRCYLSAVTLYELRLGALRRARRHPAQGNALMRWIPELMDRFAGRILDVTGDDWLLTAELNVPDPRPFRDSLIAASARNHGLVLVTRNVNDFEKLGVAIVDPWEG